MIEPAHFVEELGRRGIRFHTGVPCSYIGSLIHAMRVDPGSQTVLSTNEGDAVATAAGAALAGRGALAFMQNSGLGNAVNPLASLAWPFRLPVLLLVTLRGDPELEDEPQHRLMGRISGSLLDTLEIPWEHLPTDAALLPEAISRAQDYMKTAGRPWALLVRRGSFAGQPANEEAPALREPLRPASDRSADHSAPPRVRRGQRPTRLQALERVVAATPLGHSVVISTTGYTSRELYALEDRPNQLYMVGSMGCASAIGLGLSLARPDVRVVVLDGDGAALMRLGNLATIGAYAGANLLHVVLDNEVHESTGSQPTVSPGVSFAEVARACGYARALDGEELPLLDELFAAGDAAGPAFLHLKIRPGTRTPLPRPHVSPEQVRERFVRHLETGICREQREPASRTP